MTVEEATLLLRLNALFGAIFIGALIATVVMLLRRNISDLFMSRSLYCMIVALIVLIVMCFIIYSYDIDLYCAKQTVEFQ